MLIKRSSKVVRLDDLHVGDKFLYKNDLFLVIDIGTKVVALNLHNTNECIFTDDETVLSPYIEVNYKNVRYDSLSKGTVFELNSHFYVKGEHCAYCLSTGFRLELKRETYVLPLPDFELLIG